MPARPWLLRIAAAVVVVGAALIVGILIGRTTADTEATGTADPDDIGFLQDMSDHHGQAVLMSSHVLRHGENEQVRLLAANILSDQTNERGQMSALLTDRGAGAGAPDRMAMAWMGNPQPLDEMVGYVPGEDLAAMMNLTGEDLDIEFLELMLCHHVGGVVMATHQALVGSDPIIVDLAKRMVVTQQGEITDIEVMLDTSTAELGCDFGEMTATYCSIIPPGTDPLAVVAD